jgi:hypothetical protein
MESTFARTLEASPRRSSCCTCILKVGNGSPRPRAGKSTLIHWGLPRPIDNHTFDLKLRELGAGYKVEEWMVRVHRHEYG